MTEVVAAGRRGVAAGLADTGALRESFARDNFVLLRGFLDPAFLRQVVPRIERAAFYYRDHRRIGSEECMEVNATLARLLFAINDHRLFKAIDEVTSCGPIGCFDGRVYRLRPDSSDRDSWHSDLGDNRLVAMSVNVGAAFSGGSLQIRDARSGGQRHQATIAEPGDALLFRISQTLEHRVTSVEGTVPRTAFAGWFKSRPSFRAVLHGAGWSVAA